jgi:hypothetical protein
MSSLWIPLNDLQQYFRSWIIEISLTFIFFFLSLLTWNIQTFFYCIKLHLSTFQRLLSSVSKILYQNKPFLFQINHFLMSACYHNKKDVFVSVLFFNIFPFDVWKHTQWFQKNEKADGKREWYTVFIPNIWEKRTNHTVITLIFSFFEAVTCIFI